MEGKKRRNKADKNKRSEPVVNSTIQQVRSLTKYEPSTLNSSGEIFLKKLQY